MVVGMVQPLSQPGVWIIEQHQHEWRCVRSKYMVCVHIGGDGQRCNAFAYQGNESAVGTRMYRAIDEDGKVLVTGAWHNYMTEWEQSRASGQPVVIMEQVRTY